MFRCNIVALIFNERGEVLACRRRDNKGWQFVQGGMEDFDVDVVQAVFREIDEEIGLNPEAHPLDFAAFLPPPKGDPTKLRYLLPKFASPSLQQQGYIGQQQQVVLFYAPSNVVEHVRLVPTPELAAKGAKQEFKGVKWMSLTEFIEMAQKKKDPRTAIFQYVGLTAPQIIREFLAAKRPKPS